MTKTNKMTCAPSEDSDQSSLFAQWVAKDPMCLQTGSEYSYRSGGMPRLI